MEIYLDNSATTRVYPEVAEIMKQIMLEDYGNPSSVHNKGFDAENHVKLARIRIAAALKAKEKEILFTSGGTESDNLAIIGGARANQRAGKHIITTKIEHPAVLKTFEYLEKEELDTAYGVDGMVRDRRAKYAPTYTPALVTGIVLCVVSAIPLFAAMIFFGENDTALTVSMGILLIIVAAGVFLIVRVSMIWGSYQILLQEGDYTVANKSENKKNANVAIIYWGLATAIFLAVSFVTNAWDRTWIIWPVAGVAYGVVIAIMRVLRRQ